jgi:hypothetical protein
MKEYIIGEHKIEYHNDIKELPIKRYLDYHKYMLVESGVGSDIQSVGSHFGKLFGFLNAKMVPEATNEAKNLYFNLYQMLTGVSNKHMAFASVCAKINASILEDFSETGLQNIIKRLGDLGMTEAMVEECLEDIKKKLPAT